MSFYKNKANIVLISSMILFIFANIYHYQINKKTANASAGVAGRIVTVVPTPAICVVSPCACGGTLTTTLAPSPGSIAAVLCMPAASVPVTGVPVTPASAGQSLLLEPTVLYPTTAYLQYGTGY